MTPVSASSPETIHATALALGPYGVLLRGEPGTGKTHLALSLIEWAMDDPTNRFCRLVSDDYTEITRSTGHNNHRLIARSPEQTEGLMEIRGSGIHTIDPWPAVVVTHLFDLGVRAPERMPERAYLRIVLAGVSIQKRSLMAHDPANLAIIVSLLNNHIGAQPQP